MVERAVSKSVVLSWGTEGSNPAPSSGHTVVDMVKTSRRGRRDNDLWAILEWMIAGLPVDGQRSAATGRLYAFLRRGPGATSRAYWKFESGSLQQRVRRNRWLDNSCAAETMLHGAPTVDLGIKHFQGPAAGVGWQRSCDVII